jgi:hypothetical protein
MCRANVTALLFCTARRTHARQHKLLAKPPHLSAVFGQKFANEINRASGYAIRWSCKKYSEFSGIYGHVAPVLHRFAGRLRRDMRGIIPRG